MKTRKKNIIFHKLKKEIAIHFPILVKIYRFFFKRKKITFSGWGLDIYERNPPWIKNSFNNEAENFFMKIDRKILELVEKKIYFNSVF
jgi:hypothetical protein